MTVESTTSRVSHNGAGTTGPFTIPFFFLADADIRAIKVTIADGTEEELTLNTDFTLTGAGEAAGGELTLTASISSSYKLVIFRDPEVLQEADYSPNDRFPAETHEQVADRLTMIAQRFSDLLGRAVVQPDGDADLDMRLPASATRASKYMAFDASEQPVASNGTTSATVISTFAETLLDDTSASSMLTTLGVSAFIKTLLDDADAATAVATLAVIAKAIGTAKGDLIAFSASATPVRKAVGADGTVLTADSTATEGMSWQASGFTTGDVKLTLKTAADTGWVLMDDKTIGDASSAATGRANADTEALFTLLWNNTADADCAVSTGRGASAAADFAAHKTIVLPKTLGRALAVYGSGSGLTTRALAAATGAETHQIAQNELPNVTVNYDKPNATSNTVGQGTGNIDNAGTGFTSTATSSINGGVAQQNMTIVQPTVFLNVMIKL